MRERYDFSKGKRGPVVKVPERKEKITIRLDGGIVDWFRNVVDQAGGGNYQTGEASDQFVAAIKAIEEDNATAALNATQAVIASIDKLTTFPGLGRPGEIKGTRELVCPPYVVVYRYTDEIVHVLCIFRKNRNQVSLRPRRKST
jgi:plasmid stabilization system protein ParE